MLCIAMEVSSITFIKKVKTMNEIRKVFLEQEKEAVRKFLGQHDLTLEHDITKSFYIENVNHEIVATISSSQNIIKCLAVSSNLQGENLSSLLISHMINEFYNEKIYHYKVYTKKIYKNLFLSLGFEEIIDTDKVSILEGGNHNITKTVLKIKKQVEEKFNICCQDEDISTIVCNGNPFTLGHQSLIEEAACHSSYVIVFILEEDKSYFTFKERFSLAYVGCLSMRNVIIIPSSEYIISSLTFPSYFLKEINTHNFEWMESDVLIFKKYFMEILNIKRRYVGTEDDPFMKMYNDVLKNKLGKQLIEIKRFNGISASHVRKLIAQNQLEKALEFIPKECQILFYNISKGKMNE